MTKLPGVTIVIANYNHANYVGAAIESALAQDHAATEVIVVDDGSTDNSRDVIAGFGEAVRAIYQSNQGNIKACNAGWPLAAHDIIIFLDSDDLLAPTAASTVARTWRPGISKVQGCVTVIDGDSRPTGTVFPKYPPSLSPAVVRRALLWLGNYPCPPQGANAYSRWFLEACSMEDSSTPWIGGVLNPVAPLHGDVVTLHEPLLMYRVHGLNGWAYDKITARKLQAHIAVYRAWGQYLERSCKRMGVDFDAESALGRNLFYQQDRLVLAKLTGSGAEPEPVAPVLRGMLDAVRQSTDPVWQKFAIACWAVLVAGLPAPLSRPLISMRCEPSERPKWFHALVEHIGDRRRSRMSLKTG